MSGPMVWSLLCVVTIALMVLLGAVHSHLRAIRIHLGTIVARPDFRDMRGLADEVIVLRSALNGHFGAMHKVGARIAEKLEAIASEMRKTP
jgi:hypothetical protein